MKTDCPKCRLPIFSHDGSPHLCGDCQEPDSSALTITPITYVTARLPLKKIDDYLPGQTIELAIETKDGNDTGYKPRGGRVVDINREDGFVHYVSEGVSHYVKPELVGTADYPVAWVNAVKPPVPMVPDPETKTIEELRQDTRDFYLMIMTLVRVIRHNDPTPAAAKHAETAVNLLERKGYLGPTHMLRSQEPPLRQRLSPPPELDEETKTKLREYLFPQPTNTEPT